MIVKKNCWENKNETSFHFWVYSSCVKEKIKVVFVFVFVVAVVFLYVAIFSFASIVNTF